MTTILNHKKFLGLFLGLLFVTLPAIADVGPEEKEPAAPTDTVKSQLQAQTESAPAPAVVQEAAAPAPAPTQASQQENTAAPVAQAAAPSPNPSGIDFPKVKTDEDVAQAKKFSWWPTDAKPAPFKDPDRSGYWWWPQTPGKATPWGNQGYVYVRKIIFDYKTTAGPMKPSLVVKRILKNVKVYFDYDKSNLRDDAKDILTKAMYTLEHNPKADILITGNADVRGSEQYNLKLGERRGDSVRQYMVDQGLSTDRIKILSRGKLDAMAPVSDLVGMQKDRNAQFMIAEVEEVMIPADQANLYQDKNVEEKQEMVSAVKVSTKDYVIKKGDTLWAIAKTEYGDGRQWKRIYEFNKDVIKNPNRPKKGTKIQLPIE